MDILFRHSIQWRIQGSPPLLFLVQTEARRTEFFCKPPTHPPPFFERHWYYYSMSDFSAKLPAEMFDCL